MNVPGTKVTTVRLPEDLAADLEAVARADGVSISEALRAAVYRHVTYRRTNKDFQAKLRQRLETDKQTFERLSA